MMLILLLILQNCFLLDSIKMRNSLHLSVKKGNLRNVKRLLLKGADIEEKNEEEFTALHLAVEENNIKVVELLLEKGANIDARDKHGISSLHLAAHYGHIEIFELLLSKGDNILKEDKYGNNVIHLIAWNKNSTKAILTRAIDHIEPIEKIAAIDKPNKLGIRPLDVALKVENIKIIEHIFYLKEVVDNGIHNIPPSSLAAKYAEKDALKFLLPLQTENNILTEDFLGNNIFHYLALNPKNDKEKFNAFIVIAYYLDLENKNIRNLINKGNNKNVTPYEIANKENKLIFSLFEICLKSYDNQELNNENDKNNINFEKIILDQTSSQIPVYNSQLHNLNASPFPQNLQFNISANPFNKKEMLRAEKFLLTSFLQLLNYEPHTPFNQMLRERALKMLNDKRGELTNQEIDELLEYAQGLARKYSPFQ